MFNEMYNNNNSIRKPYKRVVKWIDSVSENNLKNKHNEAEKMFKRIGITFSIYKKNQFCFEFTFLIGVIAAFFAIITPDINDFNNWTWKPW